MKTTSEIQLIMYQVVSQTSSITGAITGGVYKERRPANSDKEDIVISEEAVTGEQLQTCKPQIRIHVPNRPIFIDGVQDLTQPDMARIDELTKIVWNAVAEKYNNNYWFYAEAQEVEAEGNEYYSNITINFNYLNT